MSEFQETIVRNDRFCGVFLQNIDGEKIISEYGKDLIRKVAKYVLVGFIAQKKRAQRRGAGRHYGQGADFCPEKRRKNLFGRIKKSCRSRSGKARRDRHGNIER